MSEFLLKPRICFGQDALSVLNELSARSVLLVTDKAMVKFGLAERVTALLRQRGIARQMWDDVVADPDIATVVRGMKLMDNHYPDLVIALGGGSVIDAAKAVIFSTAQTRPQPNRPRPCFVAIPTTSGTGSEVTAFSVVKANAEKLVLVDASLLPDIAILDPSLVAVPPAITADTGMDVLCHARPTSPAPPATFPTRWRRSGAAGISLSADLLAQRRQPTGARKMHNASCMAGMAFTNASLGITHSTATPSAAFSACHGRANALLMAQVVAGTPISTVSATPRGNEICPSGASAGSASRLAARGRRQPAGRHSGFKEEMSMPSGISNTGIEAAEFERRLPEMVGGRCATAVPRPTHARRTLTR